MSWILIPPGELRKKRKLTWFYGIHPIEIENGDFVLPERVITDVEKFDIKFKKIKIDNKDSEIDKELKKLKKEDEVKFKEQIIDNVNSSRL